MWRRDGLFEQLWRRGAAPRIGAARRRHADRHDHRDRPRAPPVSASGLFRRAVSCRRCPLLRRPTAPAGRGRARLWHHPGFGCRCRREDRRHCRSLRNVGGGARDQPALPDPHRRNRRCRRADRSALDRSVAGDDDRPRVSPVAVAPPETAPPKGARRRLRRGRMSDDRQPDRPLKSRHVSMISIGGIIGSGLFVGSSAAIAATGPAIVISYAIAGILILLVMRMLADMALAAPGAGSFTEHIRIGLGDWAGFVSGWLYWIFWMLAIALEGLAGASIFVLWFPALAVWQIGLIQIGRAHVLTPVTYAHTVFSLLLDIKKTYSHLITNL